MTKLRAQREDQRTSAANLVQQISVEKIKIPARANNEVNVKEGGGNTRAKFKTLEPHKVQFQDGTLNPQSNNLKTIENSASKYQVLADAQK